MQKRAPLVFISHKHSDSLIADEIRKWIHKWSLREVAVFQSSTPDARNPEVGRVLTTELHKALWTCGAVILVYTTEDHDWSWCMYECGVATIPESPNSRVVVFQCAADRPKVFQDQVVVDARNAKDIKKFTIAFLTEQSFFPDAAHAVAPELRPEHTEVDEAAGELFTELAKVLPSTPVAEWSAQALVRLQLASETIDKIEKGTISAPDELAAFEHAPIIGLNQQASQIFGIAEPPPGANFGWLTAKWSTGYPSQSPDWADDIRRQIREATKGGTPPLRWSYLRELSGNDRYAAVLTRVRRVPALKSVQFDVNLLPYDRSIATPVIERMIRRDDMEIVDLAKTPADTIDLLQLTAQFDQRRLNRIPVLDGESRPKMIVHLSMIDRYLRRQLAIARQRSQKSVSDFPLISLEQLLTEEPQFKHLFETSFDCVAKEARLSDANAKMAANQECYDVFVTDSGRRDEPVLGWLTDVIIAQSLGLE
jgi:hypothetical protein